MTDEVIAEIKKIIQKGNSAEVKKERDKIVVVEIRRKAKIKADFMPL